MRFISYARVSSDDQADRGYSLPTQLESNRRFEELRGNSIAAELQDDCSGAVPFAERPEGKKAMAMLKRHEAEGIVAHHVDRYSRDIVDLLATVRLWLRGGVEVHACDVGNIESELDIVLVIKGWQGSDERKKIIERTTRGRRGKARAGRVVGNGWGPYGYRFVTETDPLSRRVTVIGFEIYEPEAKVVRMIFRYYVRGDEIDNVPLSLKEICRRLSKAGIPCPGERVGRMKRKFPSGMWNPSTVRMILINEVYAGVYRYARKSEGIAVNVSALIDRATWDAAQARRAYNKKMSARNSKHEYLLRGFIKCACGYAMNAGHLGRSKNLYYRCGRLLNPLKPIDGKVCRERMVRQDVIEPFIANRILKAIVEDPDLEAALNLAQQRELAGFESAGDQLATVLEMIKETERESDHLAAIAAKTRDGIFKKSLQKQIDEVEARYKEYTGKRDKLQAKMNSRTLTDERIARILQFREDAKLGLENATIEHRRQDFETIHLQIVIQDHNMHISCILPSAAGVVEINHS